MSINQMRCAGAHPVALHAFAYRLNQCRMIGQPEIIIAAERQVTPAIGRDMTGLRAVDDLPYPPQALLLADAQLSGQIGKHLRQCAQPQFIQQRPVAIGFRI